MESWGGDEECISSGSIFDSGASHHMTSDRTLFVGVVKECSLPVKGIGGELGAVVATAVGSGELIIDGCVIGLSRLF